MDLVRLWMHECDRVYRDKLVEEKDMEYYDRIQKDITKKIFEVCLDLVLLRWNIDNLVLGWKRCLWNYFFFVNVSSITKSRILTNCTNNFCQVLRFCSQRLLLLSIVATEIFLVVCRTSMKRLCTPSLTCSVILRVELESRSTWQFKVGNRSTNYSSRHWRTTMKWTQSWILCCSMTLCSMCEWNVCNDYR